jgi:hypothetical protein
MLNETVKASGHYTVECYDKEGKLKWVDQIPNQVTTVGATAALAATFNATAPGAWNIGLVTGPASGNTYAAGDTMASHAGWTEFVNYTGNRPAASFNSASAASVSTSSPATFTVDNGGGVVCGGFIVNNATKGGTAGTLYSVGNFQQGDKSVADGDQLLVSYSASITV